MCVIGPLQRGAFSLGDRQSRRFTARNEKVSRILNYDLEVRWRYGGGARRACVRRARTMRLAAPRPRRGGGKRLGLAVMTRFEPRNDRRT